MEKTLKTGIITAASAQLANIVARSPIGTEVFDGANLSYGLENTVIGLTQATALAGATAAAYGLTKTAIKHGVPFSSEPTQVSAGLTCATSLAYGIFQTNLFENALCSMTMYSHQLQRFLEVASAVGIAAGLIVTGSLLVKDLYDLAESKLSKKSEKE